MLRKFLLVLAVLAVVGCSSRSDVSKPDVSKSDAPHINVLKLKKGMSESEVLAVMGKPDKEDGVPSGSIKSFAYTSKEPHVMLMIVDGKLKSAISGGKSLLSESS